ncbi:hypothetical protein, partial [Lonepinella sp. BR2357]|uniref:hypothetical protein n=1 Tax=Lonepinella sp. BR2357 TaxID=3434549 RepID=UPI003F6DDF6F
QFKQWLEKFMQSETFQKLLEKLKGIFTPVVTQVKQSAETNNLLRKLVNLVSQHKIITAVVAATVVVAPSFVGTSAKIEFPAQCKGFKFVVPEMGWDIFGKTALRQMLEAEDPETMLADNARALRFSNYDGDPVYSNEKLQTLFFAHYEKLAKSSQTMANSFAKMAGEDCERRRKHINRF